MLIRCEKCGTTYELEERLIPPGGAPVQCSRCEHVFRAYPPSRANGDAAARSPTPPPGAAPGDAAAERDRRPGLELVPPPANDFPAPVAAEESTPAAGPELPAEPALVEVTPPFAAEVPSEPSTPVSQGAPGPSSTAGSRSPPPPTTYKPPPGPVIPPGRPVRKVPNPELEGTDVPSVAPVPRRGMTVDVGSRRRSKSSWVVWGAVGLLAFLVVVGMVSFWRDDRAAKAEAAKASVAVSRVVSRERQDALKLLMRDDAASVERAAALLDGAVRREPASGARADRALALALLSLQAREQAARQEGRARTLDDERARAAAAPDGVARAAELAAEADSARADVDPLRERAGRLLTEARTELEALPAELAGDVATVRARAWALLAAGDRAGAARTARGPNHEDPWLALASIMADVPDDAGGDAQRAAADRLEQLAAKVPDFVRPLFVAGRLRAQVGEGERAVRDLDAVLKLNPQHADARRLRAELGSSVPDAATPAAGEGAAPAVNERSHGGNEGAPAQGR